MAGDWIKVESVTPNKPEVFKIADLCDIEPEHAFGSLLCIWIWADQHTEDGNAVSVTRRLVDRTAGVTGFADAMEKVGWLVIHPDGACFPNFDRHNGKTAKNRALTAKRVANHKLKSNDNSNGASVSSALPREEKRREEKEDKTISLPAIKYDPADNIPEGVNANSWLEWVEYRKKAKKKISEAAARKQFKFLMEYTEPVQAEIIDLSITNDYQGLFAPKGSAGSTGLAVQAGGFIKKHTDRSWADEM
jgi:hypothetical protein